MKLVKPQWNLAIHILPPIFSTLGLVIFFPAHLFQFLIGIVVLSVILGSWLSIKNLSLNSRNPEINTFQHDSKAKGTFQWLSSLLGLIFLLGLSSVFFIFLTAANQLAPEKLVFGEVARIWQITFPIGICLLIVQIITAFLSEKEITHSQYNLIKRKNSSKIQQFLDGKDAETTKKMLMSNQIFLRFSSFIVLVISSSVVILSIANGLARWLGFEIPNGVQLQTIIGSTLLYLPFATKRWRKYRFLQQKRSRALQFLVLGIGLIVAIALLSFLTLPLAGLPISVQFLSYGLTVFQWKLFILAWWIGMTPLIAKRVIHLSNQRALKQILMALMILGSGVYGIFLELLAHAGEEYFLTVIREGILALILTALPLGILILNVLSFQTKAEIEPNHLDHRKQFRDKGYVTHSLIQATVIAYALYWVSGLSILFVLLLIVTVPWLMGFLFVQMNRVYYYN